jgi:hypothetical protein
MEPGGESHPALFVSPIISGAPTALFTLNAIERNRGTMPYEAKSPLTPGRKVMLRGREFVIPALDLEQTETLEADIDKLGPGSKESFSEILRAAARILQVALSENYPEITLAEVKKVLDLKNYGDAFRASLGQESAGEPKAAASGPTPAATLANGATEDAELKEIQERLASGGMKLTDS